jgi:hypothetical protein
LKLSEGVEFVLFDYFSKYLKQAQSSFNHSVRLTGNFFELGQLKEIGEIDSFVFPSQNVHHQVGRFQEWQTAHFRSSSAFHLDTERCVNSLWKTIINAWKIT